MPLVTRQQAERRLVAVRLLQTTQHGQAGAEACVYAPVAVRLVKAGAAVLVDKQDWVYLAAADPHRRADYRS